MPGTPTTRLGLGTISGSVDIPANFPAQHDTNLGILDKAVRYFSGALASRTSIDSSPIAGDLFQDTTGGLLYEYDGSVWHTLVRWNDGATLASLAVTYNTTIDGNLTVDGTPVGNGWSALSIYSGSGTLSPPIGTLTVAVPGQTVDLPAPTAANQLVGVIANTAVTGASPVLVGGIGGIYHYGPGFSFEGGGGFTTLGSPQSYLIFQSYNTTTWECISGQQDTGWVALTPASGYSTPSGWYPAAARQLGNMCYLRGALTTSGSAGSYPASLPAFAAPSSKVTLIMYSTGDSSIVLLTISGTSMTASGGLGVGGTTVYFDGMSYSLS